MGLLPRTRIPASLARVRAREGSLERESSLRALPVPRAIALGTPVGYPIVHLITRAGRA